MYSIKRETAEVPCYGCLSTDRKLSSLTNYEMFFAVLGNKQTLEDYKYLNILLCWECQALLRRTQEFRNTLQRAQYLLSVTHTEQIPPETLSKLNYKHKQDYDHTIEESTEAKTEIEIFINSKDIPNIPIKEEFEDNLDNDHFDTLSDNCKEEKEVKSDAKKKPYKKDREKREFKKIYNGLDLNNLDKYFSRINLSEKEVDEALVKEREADVSRPLVCDSCGFSFVSKSDLHEHGKTVHKVRVKKVKCPHCSSPYKTLWDLELHCWRSHPVNRCVVCRRVLAHDNDRRKHLRLHQFRYRCLKCAVDFGDKPSFLHHEKQLHTKYTCEHCGKTAPSKKRLEKHMIRHHLSNKCPSCGLVFTNWERFRRHVRDVHERSGPAYCVECDLSFLTPAKYRRHLSQSARHRPKKKISVPCPECGKVFSRKNYMNNHMKLFHSNQSRHHCPLCDKYFVNGWGLRTHNKFVHEKIPMPKNKICSVCGRGFATNRVLENHMRTHTGERPFSCARCAAAFAQRVALKAHLAAIHKDK